ncbi:NUDIX hydrolase [Nocardioides psychrotolerans]|uniref:8-oxo-dGTP diphosphatase n=1 Tax=Nocardioides psychrotolerans TaxID=1005945 RepID=A0A1I3NAK2_9ACTN|nr:NUDIX domain-containing protein [Nocardioides psychrotolerans]SFJ06363.1 8-oxo-dGTP diphosphatase [Nocardioides psychrotolerans]
MPVSGPQDVQSAGVVVFRSGKRVLLVHRPKYDDWSFPKGKLDPGEHAAAAAVREVAEETGLHVRLGPPLRSQRYALTSAAGRMKAVFYWTGRVVGDDDVSGYLVNEEIDDVRWVDAAEAFEQLTYLYDADTLREALKVRRKTHPVVVLRHAAARSRKAWRGEDVERPLLAAGRTHAQRLVPLLAAYGVTRIVTSGSLRCVETVAPYADTTGWALECEEDLSEEGASATRVRSIVDGVLEDPRPVVICTHRPVLPAVFGALGIDDPGLALGEMLVAHLRKGEVVAVERHRMR